MKLRKKVLHFLRQLRLSDRCLLAFMVLLWVQTIVSLCLVPTAEHTGVDVALRTTAAAIFGYFISGNFLREPQQGGTAHSNAPQQLQAQGSPSLAMRRIGFGNETAPLIAAENPPVADTQPRSCRVRQQVLIVASLGFCAVILLVFIRSGLFYAPDALTSQLRDFASSSVGLLIGHSVDRM